MKTHVSDSLFEFAKRLILKEQDPNDEKRSCFVEISPFPFSSIAESHKRCYLLVNLLTELEKKGWKSIEGIGANVSLFYSVVLHRPSRFRKAMESDSITCDIMMKIMSKTITACEGMNTLTRHLGFTGIRELTEEESEGILSNIAVECFAESNPCNQSEEDKKKGYPLGALAEYLTLNLTDLYNRDIPEDLCPMELIYSLPHLRVYGAVEETYIDFLKQARRIDTVDGGK